MSMFPALFVLLAAAGGETQPADDQPLVAPPRAPQISSPDSTTPAPPRPVLQLKGFRVDLPTLPSPLIPQPAVPSLRPWKPIPRYSGFQLQRVYVDPAGKPAEQPKANCPLCPAVKGECPAACPVLPNVDVTVKPAQSSDAGGLQAKVVRLKNIPAKAAAMKLAGLLKQQKIQTAGDGPVGKTRLVCVPDAASNSLCLVASPKRMRLVRALLAEIDRAPAQYQIEMTITELRPDGAKRVVCRPKMITTLGRPATLLTSGTDQTMRVEVQVSDRKKRLSPSLTISPSPYRQAQPARSGQKGGAILPAAASRPAVDEPCDPFAEPKSKPSIVCVYTVADLIGKNGKDGEAEELETLASLIRMTVTPTEWSETGGSAVARVFEAKRCLVVRQSPAGHAAIATLLEQLRNVQSGGK